MDMLTTRGTVPQRDPALGAGSAIERAHGHWSVRPAIATATVAEAGEDRGPGALEGEAPFERMIADLSARLGEVSSDEVGATIASTLRRCTDALGMDRGTVLQIAPGEALTVRYDSARPGLPVVPAGTPAAAQFPGLCDAARAGDLFSYTRVDAVASASERDSLRRLGTRSGLTVPLRLRGAVVGALCFTMHRDGRRWSPEIIERARLVGTVIAGALALERSDAEQRKTQAEMQRLRVRLEEGVGVTRDASVPRVHRGLAADSAAIQRVLAQVEQVAPTTATVLLAGETGTGKEVFAQTIHDLSTRHKRPMVRVNCGAIPSALIESELFGRERGAYTGALSRQAGKFELAEGSTIFLDEVGELPLEAQVKLLRVLQEREVERLGGSRPIKVDVRVIAASNKDLERAVAERTFREDLFYRLNVFPITVPPLRERVADIPLLIWTFIDEYARAFGKPISSISKESLAALQQYAWPGNVRELRNIIERAMITASGPHLNVDAPRSSAASRRRSVKLADVEIEHIRSVLEETGWRVRGPHGAAVLLGLKPTTLESRLAKLGLKRVAAAPGALGL
jgi:formate hydrogenlyase transcriptional activator